jgi:gamma-glutamyltranspeptidase / glutathione hydrolase / leukotriene-C4 hydrolase
MFGNNSRAALKGPLAVAVPGELAGYWAARQRFGNRSLSWRRIIQPTIDLCRNGIPVSWTLADVLSDYEFALNGTPAEVALRETFTDPTTGRVLQKGQLYRRPALADTLDRLAAAEESLVNLFYRGELGRQLLADLPGGIISEADLAAYSARWEDPVVLPLAPLLNLTLYSVPPPGSGAVLAAILNIIQHSDHFGEDALFFHRLVEAFKFAYGARSRLGDPRGDDPALASAVSQLVSNMTSSSWGWDRFRLINDSATLADLSLYGADFLAAGAAAKDHGTAHVSVLAANGDAVAVTSTINQEFGAGLLSPTTGIIFNDEMDDFAFAGFANDFNLPPSAANSVRPGKRPLSSMSPTIFLDAEGRARLIIGAAGGSKITTATALTAVRQLWLNETAAEAVARPRVHHQLSPNVLEYQSELDRAIVSGLTARGHVVKDRGGAGSVVGAIAVAADGRVEAAADYRKAGAVDGY